MTVATVTATTTTTVAAADHSVSFRRAAAAAASNNGRTGRRVREVGGGLRTMRMASALKTIVSKNKRRHVEDGYNLDLSYINDRIIAMGFPAENVESLYRNSLDEVKSFLEKKHEGHYFIYNLCSERYYDVKKFHNRVATYPFDDHHPPDFASIKPFCDDVESWLAKHPKNVAVVHCKAGKGRTGVMICCYLLHSRRFPTAEDVLEFYGTQRTVDKKGVTIPSQRRYINYYSSIVRDGLTYRPVKLYLRMLVVDPVPAFAMAGQHEFYLQFEVRQSGAPTYVSREYVVREGERQVRLEVEPPLPIGGDVKVEFSSKYKLLDLKINRQQREFHFWFNTFFVDSPFSSGLSHTVSSRSPSYSVEEEEEESGGCVAGQDTSSSSHEGLVLRDSTESSDSGRLLPPPPAANGGGVYQNRGLRSYPAPERHASCTGGGASAQADGGAPVLCDDAESLTNLMKATSVSHDHLLREKSAPLTTHQQQNDSQRQQQHQQHRAHLPVRQSQSHHLQHQHSHHGGVGVGHVSASMATSTSSSSSSSSSSNANSGAASTTTLMSFNEMLRKRHTSMPQPKVQQSSQPKHSSAVFDFNSASGSSSDAFVPGTPVSLHLRKKQIDKAFKDKHGKEYPDNFQVHLFLLRPDDQSDAGKFSSSPVCVNKGSGDVSSATSKQKLCQESCSSSEEDTTDSEALCGGGGGGGTQKHHHHQGKPFQPEWI